MAFETTDPVVLLENLVKCASVTPVEGGALDLVQHALEALGFTCTRLIMRDTDTPDVDNLFARLGSGTPHFCFAGHTDVVPVGNADDWTYPPFSATIKDGHMYGRGASDMKGGVACFIAAVTRYLEDLNARDSGFQGSISLLITGDEEGPAINGTVKVLSWMAENNHTPDHCIVGEPTSLKQVGDMIKIGRRGSINGHLVVEGKQGHVAYQHRAKNPFYTMVRILSALALEQLDDGNEHFESSNLEITAVDTNNPASNVIPAKTEARFNIRYNNDHSGDSLVERITKLCREAAGDEADNIHLTFENSGESFLTQPDEFVEIVKAVIKDKTGLVPELSTGGGTSDARFVTNFCPVIEFGAVGERMHGVDERANIANLEILTNIYQDTLTRYFG